MTDRIRDTEEGVSEKVLHCYCGRPYDKKQNRHTDDGDPWWCYPEEKGLDDDSRCNAMWDGEDPS